MSDKYTKKDLIRLTEEPLSEQYNRLIAKVMEAIADTEGNILLCFSGGKDSALMLDVYCECAKILGFDNIKVGYADTTNETTEMRRYIPQFIERCEKKYEINIELKKTRPKNNITFAKVILEKGVPFISKQTASAIRKTKRNMKEKNITYEDVKKHANADIKSRDALREMGLNDTSVLSLTGWSCRRNEFGTKFKIAKMWLPFLGFDEVPITEECCIVLKESPLSALSYKNIMTGEQAMESVSREAEWLKKGCNYNVPDGGYRSKPLGSLSPQAVLYSIYHRHIPLCEDYGTIIECNGCYKCTGAKRTGCSLCGFGIKFDQERFVRLQKTEEAKINWAFKPRSQGGAGYRELCEFSNEYCGTKILIPN